MRICLLGDATPPLDEGMKKIGAQLRHELQKTHDVLAANPLEAASPAFWTTIHAFRPQVLHYIPGPSWKSFLLMQLLSRAIPTACTIMSTPLPMISRLAQPVIPFMKPDLMLVHSHHTEAFFKDRGFPTAFCSLSGIDNQRFAPPSMAQKAQFRAQYGIPSDTYVVLHVGHIQEARNLASLARVQTCGNVYVLIVGSTSTPIERSVYAALTAKGCHVITEYLADIHEVYALADCYVFPVLARGCIELPLSVLEAMACNLPIISTRFGGLNRLFHEGQGLVFIDDIATLPQVLTHLQQSPNPINTRRLAQKYSWSQIAQNLERIYHDVFQHRSHDRSDESAPLRIPDCSDTRRPP